MKLNRRGFLSLSAMLGVSYAERSSALNLGGQDQKYAILQTYTDATVATFSAILPKDRYFSVSVTDEQGRLVGQVQVDFETRDHSKWRLANITAEGLSLQENYLLTFTDTKGGSETRRFKTLDLEKKDADIAILSCMSDKTHRPRMWRRLQAEKPEALFFVGDAVYADMTTSFEWRAADRKQLWDRFIQAWQTLDIYRWQELVPVFATWDDHDYGDNNSDRTYKHKEAAYENFKLFYGPRFETGFLEQGPGVSFLLKAFGQRFLFLDGRTFKSEAKAEWQTLFGQEQEQWIFSKLSASKKPVWLINGSQWFGGYLKKESYEYTHNKSFWAFIADLKSSRRFISFISGDVHFSEVMQIEEKLLGYETLEITSSSMHSFTVPGWHRLFKNKRRIASAGRHNFSLLELRREGRIQDEKVTCIGERRRPYYSVSRRLRF